MRKKYHIFILLSFLFVLSGVLPGFLAVSNATKAVDLADVPILFVDDDGGTSFDTYFTSILDDLDLDWNNITYRPNATEMSQYTIVIWHTGDYEGPGNPSEYRRHTEIKPLSHPAQEDQSPHQDKQGNGRKREVVQAIPDDRAKGIQGAETSGHEKGDNTACSQSKNDPLAVMG